MSSGLFIVLEGIDGAGKTEQSGRLCVRLRALGCRVLETREPTDGVWGRGYRSFARGELEASADEVLEFFLRDRREHVDREIAPALLRGDVVVCDRYVASTLAYQAAQGIDREKLRARSDAEAFPVPDLTLWLRLPIQTSLGRLGSRVLERFEREAFLERVDQEYKALGFEPIDAAGRVEQVEAELWERGSPLLPSLQAR